MLRIFGVRLNPADVLAPTKAPLLQALSPQIQTVRRAAPQKHEAPLRGDIFDVQAHDLVPAPELHVGHAAGSLVLFQRWLDQHDVELEIQIFQIERLEIAFQVHRRRGRLADQSVLQFDQLLEFRILFEAVLQADITYEVLWTLTW